MKVTILDGEKVPGLVVRAEGGEVIVDASGVRAPPSYTVKLEIPPEFTRDLDRAVEKIEAIAKAAASADP